MPPTLPSVLSLHILIPLVKYTRYLAFMAKFNLLQKPAHTSTSIQKASLSPTCTLKLDAISPGLLSYIILATGIMVIEFIHLCAVNP